jgi:hypothetical protein
VRTLWLAAAARFWIRVCSAFGLIFLVAVAGEVAAAASGSANSRILFAVLSGVFLLNSFWWFWWAARCRRGARATAQACAGMRQDP